MMSMVTSVPYSITPRVVARDLKALSDFLLGTLMQLPGVNGVRSSVCLDEIKATSALPLEH